MCSLKVHTGCVVLSVTSKNVFVAIGNELTDRVFVCCKSSVHVCWFVHSFFVQPLLIVVLPSHFVVFSFYLKSFISKIIKKRLVPLLWFCS